MKGKQKHKPFIIPPPYYEPAMYAIKLFRHGYHLGEAIRLSYNSYTDPSLEHPLTPYDLNKNKLTEYIFKWLRGDLR